MRARAAGGERARALRAYDEARARFETELGAEPDAETRRLRDQIAGGA
jgi:DNA-binding SARP family transcriptional activator